jgi:GNAT superfamily N-acetyltransferase
MPVIRTFMRPDRDQLTELVNVHIAAVVPGWALPVSALLAQFEREPSQYVVDPWVIDRTTLVAIERDRVVAGAHLKRYGADTRVSPDYYGAGEVAWLVAWPRKHEAALALAHACTAKLDEWQVRRQWADGALPTPATFGIPSAWPHVRTVIEEAGFSDDEGRTEMLLAGELETVGHPDKPPLEGLRVRREVDNLAVRFSAVLGDQIIGYVNVHDDLTRGGTLSCLRGWAQLHEQFVEPPYRRQGVGTWLVRHAVWWLRLGGATRILATWAEELDAGSLAFLHQFGWHEIESLRRGWRRATHGESIPAPTLHTWKCHE